MLKFKNSRTIRVRKEDLLVGRKANPKCVYCAKNYTEEQAQEINTQCYVLEKRLCYHRRRRLANRDEDNAKQRDRYAKKQGIETIETILPDALWVELVIYGIKHQTVHAVGLRIYQGNQIRYKMSPQHTQGFSSGELREYIDKIMIHLEAEYDIDRIGRYYWSDRTQCPVCTKGKF